MKSFRLLLMVVLLGSFCFSAKIGILQNIMKPVNISVYENELYVLEGAEVTVYSLKELKSIGKIGKKGEGPGEIKVIFPFYNNVRACPDYNFLTGFEKVIFFSKDGKVIKETKKPFQSTRVVPIGENFVVQKNLVSKDGKTLYDSIFLHDSQMKEIKELYRQKHVQQGNPPQTKARLDMVMDLLFFEVYQDKIFIDASPNGFLIEVFDAKGNKLYQIKNKFEALKVTDADKDEVLKGFKEDPLMKQVMKQVGGWEAFEKMYIFNYADTYPAIQNLAISNNKLYVQTFKLNKAKDKSEYVVMDLKGKVIKKVYLPRFENTPMFAKILGSRLHTIYNDRLYYLLENEKEEWELHMVEIK